MNLLVIAPRYPWPLEKGDKLRLFQQIGHLSREYGIHLFAISHHPVPEDDLAALRPYCQQITIARIPRYRLPWNLLRGLFLGLPFSVAYFTDRLALATLKHCLSTLQPDLVYAQLARSGEYLRCTSGPRVIDLMDAFSHIARQRARISPWWMRPFLRWEASLLERYERKLAQVTDRQVFITQRDREMLDPEGAWPALVVPNGIDTSFFYPLASQEPSEDLVFVGNMGYFPNIAAARYLVRDVLPLVRATRPDVRVLIAGARPGAAVQVLGGSGVRIEGWLKDIRTAYAAGRIFVAPLFHGAGQQNKIFEAMAMGIPVITTPHVHAGIRSAEEVMLLADTPEAFAQQILLLLNDPDRRAMLADRALHFVTQNHSWSQTVTQLDQFGFQPLINPA